MKLNSIRQATVRAAVLGLCGIALASAPAARAEDHMTVQSLIDRQLILDQITRYYYNFGKVDRQPEESFYAEDGELILGTRHYKGKEGIRQAYRRASAAPPAGAASASGAAPAAAAPPRERTAFNVAIENPLIVVHGDTATSQVIFTEYRQDKVGVRTAMPGSGGAGSPGPKCRQAKGRMPHVFPVPDLRKRTADPLDPPAGVAEAASRAAEAGQGAGRGRGRPAHNSCGCSAMGKRCGIRLKACPTAFANC
jgi:hypothetical protein